MVQKTLSVSGVFLHLELLILKQNVSYNPVEWMQKEVCVCICVCMSIPWEESIMKKRTQAARESVNTELFACVHRQNGSNFHKRMYCFSLCACVCMCQSGSDPLTWQPVLRECTHPCHYCSTHSWLTAFSSAQELSVSQSHWWFQAKVNALERRWQGRLTICDWWSHFYGWDFLPHRVSQLPVGSRILNVVS